MEELKPVLLTQGEPDVPGSTLNPKQISPASGKAEEMGGFFDHCRKSFERFSCKKASIILIP